jgi:hypothetical protein
MLTGASSEASHGSPLRTTPNRHSCLDACSVHAVAHLSRGDRQSTPRMVSSPQEGCAAFLLTALQTRPGGGAARRRRTGSGWAPAAIQVHARTFVSFITHPYLVNLRSFLLQKFTSIRWINAQGEVNHDSNHIFPFLAEVITDQSNLSSFHTDQPSSRIAFSRTLV